MTSKRQQQEEAGRWLRRARESRGLHTAGALARRMGVSDSLISRIETGATAVTSERAEQIAKALGMDIIIVRRNLHLWVPDDEPPADPMGAAEAILDDSERIAARLKELNRRDREVVESALDALIQALKSAAEKPGVEDNNHR